MIMDNQQMTALGKRVEQAEGPNGELDRDISRIVGTWQPPDRGDPYGTAEPYTASLDAAKSLWPKGWYIRVTQVRFGAWIVQGWRGDKSVQTPADVESLSMSEECARTAAALKARALTPDPHNG